MSDVRNAVLGDDGAHAPVGETRQDAVVNTGNLLVMDHNARVVANNQDLLGEMGVEPTSSRDESLTPSKGTLILAVALVMGVALFCGALVFRYLRKPRPISGAPSEEEPRSAVNECEYEYILEKLTAYRAESLIFALDRVARSQKYDDLRYRQFVGSERGIVGMPVLDLRKPETFWNVQALNDGVDRALKSLGITDVDKAINPQSRAVAAIDAWTENEARQRLSSGEF